MARRTGDGVARPGGPSEHGASLVAGGLGPEMYLRRLLPGDWVPAGEESGRESLCQISYFGMQITFLSANLFEGLNRSLKAVEVAFRPETGPSLVTP